MQLRGGIWDAWEYEMNRNMNMKCIWIQIWNECEYENEKEYGIYMHSHPVWMLHGKMKWNEEMKWGMNIKDTNTSKTTNH